MGIKNLLNHLNRRDTRLFPYFTKLTLVLVLISSVFFVGRVLAQSIYKDTNDAIKEGTNQEAWLNNGFNTNLVSVSNALVGEIPEEVLSGTGAIWIPGGLAGTTSNTIASLYNPPASGIEYLAQAKDSFLGKPAYAQGIGFKGLEPLLPIWRSFRNFTYILSSVLFIILGLLIVLRVKISQQAVISIQNAVPQIISTLLLITFSYAIVGLLIDLSYLFQAIAVGLIYPEVFNSFSTQIGQGLYEFFATKIPGFIAPNLETYTNPNIMVLVNSLVIPWFVSIGLVTLISSMIGSLVSLPALLLPGGAIGVVGGTIGFGAVGSIIATIVLSLIMIVWLIKFLFGIFKAYATLIFKIVIAPLEIAMGSFPGSKVGFSSWIMDIIANLLVFPISFLFIILSNKIVLSILITGGIGEIPELIINIVKGNPISNDVGLWAPQILGGGSLAGSGLIAVGAISLSTLFLLSKLPEMIPQFIFMIKPSPWGQAIGQVTGQEAAKASNTGKFGWNTGVQLATAGLESGAGPHKLIDANRRINTIGRARYGMDEGEAPKQVANILRQILTKK